MFRLRSANPRLNRCQPGGVQEFVKRVREERLEVAIGPIPVHEIKGCVPLEPPPIRRQASRHDLAISPVVSLRALLQEHRDEGMQFELSATLVQDTEGQRLGTDALCALGAEQFHRKLTVEARSRGE